MHRWIALIALFAISVAHSQTGTNSSNIPLEKSKSAYFSGDLVAARAGLVPMVEKGHAEASYYLGLVERDQAGSGLGSFSRAIQLWHHAASEGHTQSMRELGNSYDSGVGVEADVLFAVHWYRRAEQAALANRSSKDIVYLDSAGQPMTPTESAVAIKKLEKRALGRDAEQAYSLARLYDLGEHVERDPAAAAHWYEVAANSGHQQSALLLAYFTCRGVAGFTRDTQKANEWLNQSNRAGNCTANHAKE